MINQKFPQQKTITTKQVQATYPTALLKSMPKRNVSLEAQVKRQFKQGLARHISNNIYRLTLSKNTTVIDKPELDKALAPLKIKPNQIQYIEQSNNNIIVNITVLPSLVKKFMKG